MDKAKKSFVIASLRRASYRWYGRWQASKRSHIGRNEYFCENPECGMIGKKKEFQMDHIDPVVDPLVGWQGLDSFAERLLCEPEGYWRICKTCHKNKTLVENQIRKENKKKT
jgi:hypothetical protein